MTSFEYFDSHFMLEMFFTPTIVGGSTNPAKYVVDLNNFDSDGDDHEVENFHPTKEIKSISKGKNKSKGKGESKGQEKDNPSKIFIKYSNKIILSIGELQAK